jgi:hypothetical protein
MIDLMNLETLWMRIRPWQLDRHRHQELVAALESQLVLPRHQLVVGDMPNKARFYWLDAELRQNARHASAWLPLAAKESDLAVATLTVRLVAEAGKVPERKKILLHRAFRVGDMGVRLNTMLREVETYRKIMEIIGDKLVDAKSPSPEQHRPDMDKSSPDSDRDDVPIDLPQPNAAIKVLANPLVIAGDRETVERLKAFRELEKPIARAPINADWRKRMPSARWFGPVIKLIERRLAPWRNTPFKMTPLLIQGAPGIGKSRFIADLAAALEVPILPISFAGQSDSRALLGTARGWSSANPSSIVELILRCKRANPIVFIDELEKSTPSQNGDPLAAVLTLLEPETAKRFHDPFLSTEVDLSHVSWIAGANSLRGLPAPILSRFHVIQVEAPDGRDWPDIRSALTKEFARSSQISLDAMPALAPPIDEMMRMLLDRRRDLRVVRRVFEDVLLAAMEAEISLMN